VNCGVGSVRRSADLDLPASALNIFVTHRTPNLLRLPDILWIAASGLILQRIQPRKLYFAYILTEGCEVRGAVCGSPGQGGPLCTTEAHPTLHQKCARSQVAGQQQQ
ncbi:hypothetical protein OTU49_001586, partial [Cherax quadricarinatus]